jgi:hypothetical protein
MLECRFNKTTHHPKSTRAVVEAKGGGGEEEEDCITSGNWRGKHNSLSRGGGGVYLESYTREVRFLRRRRRRRWRRRRRRRRRRRSLRKGVDALASGQPHPSLVSQTPIGLIKKGQHQAQLAVAWHLSGPALPGGGILLKQALQGAAHRPSRRLKWRRCRRTNASLLRLAGC